MYFCIRRQNRRIGVMTQMRSAEAYNSQSFPLEERKTTRQV